MQRNFLHAKLHQARVTQADLEYEGSFSVDSEILEAAGILENEQIHVYNIDNAHRFVTYAIPAPYGSRIMGANGACAHLVSPGHRVIICTYAQMSLEEYQNFQPKILFLDESNNYKKKIYSDAASVEQSEIEERLD